MPSSSTFHKLWCPLGPKYMLKEDVYKFLKFYELTNVGLFKVLHHLTNVKVDIFKDNLSFTH